MQANSFYRILIAAFLSLVFFAISSGDAMAQPWVDKMFKETLHDFGNVQLIAKGRAVQGQQLAAATPGRLLHAERDPEAVAEREGLAPALR